MRSARSVSGEPGWSFNTILAIQQTRGAQPSEWARSLFFQGMVEEGVARNLEHLFRDVQDVEERFQKDEQILVWFERQIISAPGSTVGAAMTRGTVEEYEQLSFYGFSNVVEWLLPRFWSDPNDLGRVRTVVARLREAYNTALLLARSWFAPVEQGSSSSFFDRPLPSSAAGVAYWAYYLDRRDSMSPEQRLRHLSILGRWYPGQAFMYVLTELKEYCQTFTTEEYYQSLFTGGIERSLNEITRAAELWLTYDQRERAPNRPPDRMVEFMRSNVEDFVRPLHQLDVSLMTKVYSEPRLEKWIHLTASLVAEDYYRQVMGSYRDYQYLLAPAYFPNLMSRQMPLHEEIHFPAGGITEFALNRVEEHALRQVMGLEERLVRRLLHLLLDKHAVATGLPHNAVLRAFLRDPNFTFSISEEMFRQLYDQALIETVTQVATEHGYDCAWRCACAAITLVYGVSLVCDAPLFAFPEAPPEASALPEAGGARSVNASLGFYSRSLTVLGGRERGAQRPSNSQGAADISSEGLPGHNTTSR
ncbi:hypothetical protein GNI_016570 [Gregarina niphandrodes]|uniref:Uncharacterized protein n=1 Tax=Gregarina niphandrodes TaxID=110365 RepID=A0A023BCA6_GRENI|nr:hypothetical protein GNI_016570 [Gregarina niphandrodes]EZG82432.1 hypothetical protein GNI_016570 [Gregarina niphandrodes]|eukprot:XP_011129001.1 hypothetical protein GNI_016570 [Gregarina niphandrodes]